MDNSAVSKSTKSTITGGPGRTINTNMGFCGSKVDALSVDDGVLHNDCFIDVLNIIPHCVFLLISLPILIVWSKSVIGTKKVKTWVHFQVHAIRWVLTLILIFTNILEVAEGLTSDARDPDTVNYHVFIPQCMAAIGTTVSITYYHNVEIWNSPGFLIVLWGYWAAALFLKVLKLISLYNNNLNMEDMRVWLTWIVIILYGILILIEVDVLRLQKYAFFKKSYPVHSPDELIDLKYIHPYVSFISKATFWWITNFLRKGYHHVIELHDLGKLPLREQAVLNFEKLQKTYEEEHLKASEKNQKPSLLRSLLKASWPILALSASFRLGADLLAFVGPWWIESIVDYAYLNQNSPPPTSILGNSTSRKEALTITIQEFLSNGYVITVLVFMMMLIQHTLMQYHFFMVVREGMRMKGALQVMIYNKLLQLSSQAIQNGLVSETEILNYTATDTNHIFIFFSFIHYFWAVPLQILLGFVLVCFKMGPSAAIGAVIIVFHAFVHFVIAGQFTRLQLKYMISSDRRVKKVNGIIHGIKMLKINAWERIFCSQVEKEREKELRDVFSLAGYKTFVELLVTAAPLTSTLMTLVNYYYIEGESVTPGKIFSTIALFQVMNSSLYFLSVMYNCIGNVKVSIRQLEPFLTSTNICRQHTSTLLEDKLPPTIHIEAIHPEDKVDTVIRYDVTSESTSLSLHKENGALHGSQNSLESTLQHTPGHSRQSSGASLLEVLGSKRLSLSQHSSTVTLEGMDFPEHRRRRCFSGVSMEDEEDMAEILRIYETRTILEVNNGNFSWHSTDEPFLKNINLKIPAGKLTMIIGPSGSGKTSLLNAILGEMIQHSGSVNWSRNTSLAYLSQPPWIMNRTIQENILFGQPYSWRRYKRVLHACALHHDLGLMPSGDRTEIGEKGITLNEGQKQRVSLARALYSHADTIILDDAFSCMEPHQSKAVFDDAVVRRFLRRKRTVILTTTQLHNINQASQIIAMKNCTIRCQGKLSEVKKMDAELYESWRKALKEIKKDIDHDQERPRKSSFDHSQPPELVVRQLSVQSQLGVPISRHVSQMSVMTETSQEDEGLEEEESFEQDGRLIKLDNRDIRSVTLSVYKEYFKSCSLTLVVIAILLLVAKHFFLAVTDVWLLHWTSQEMLFLQGRRENATAAANEPVNSLYHLLIYVGLAFVTLLVSGIAGLILKLATLRGARLLHQKLLTSVLCLPIRFFEMTSSVGILNMFTADVRVVDQALPTTLELLLRSGLLGLAVIVVSSIATPYFIVIAVPLLVVFYFLERFYRPTSRQLQRLQNLAKTPLFTHFSEILTGIKTVRAYRAQQWFQRQMMHSVDIYNVVFLYTHAINRWLGVRLDFMGSAVLLLATLTSLTTAIFVDGCPAAVGLCLLYAFMMPSYLNWISRYLSELDMNACSVEKILDYSADTEKKNNGGGDVNIEKNWPDKGEIVFSHVALQYDPNQSPVIKDATFTINEGEMVALCGHTGSGRSSLIMALFKMIDLSEGQIIIDNRDIAHVPAAVLCSRLSVVPHDPVLFDGTLRFNLDLENKHNDEALWNALENVHLKDVIQDLPQKLDTPVKESGKNFSITERQLFCLARALLRCPRILIVEQSHVHHRDTLAEEKIQQVIESAFTNTTVISLIHHLTNLKMYDRLMVLQHGRVVEYDTPEALTSNENSMLVNLLRENQFRHPGRGSVIA